MPSELRRIVFSNDELRQALDAYYLGLGKSLPIGYARSARFAADPSQLVISIYDRREDRTHEVELKATQVAAALIKFCFSHRIPIPKHAQKSLALSGDNVALDVRKDPAHGAAVVISDAGAPTARAG